MGSTKSRISARTRARTHCCTATSWPNALALTLLAAVAVTLAARRFRATLD